MRALQLSNLKALARVGTWLVFWAIAVNLALYGLSATSLLSWLPDRQTGVGFALDNKQRVEGAEQEYRDGSVRPDKRLGAIVGISNIREAVDLDMVNQELGSQWRFIGLAGAGAGASSIVDNARILEDSDLRPDLIIVGSAPLQTLDKLLPGAFSPPAPSGRARLKVLVKQLVWLNARRRDVSVSTERGLLDARAALFDLFNVALPTPDTRTPWRSMLRVMGAERFPDKAFRDGVTWAHSIGAFDPEAYERSRAAPRMLAETVRELASKGSRVVVVLTPEHSLLRSREPKGIADYLQDRLRRESGIRDLEVLDYRSSVADDGFTDLVHLNTSGSKRFTPLLVRDLLRQRWSTPPLMAASFAMEKPRRASYRAN